MRGREFNPGIRIYFVDTRYVPFLVATDRLFGSWRKPIVELLSLVALMLRIWSMRELMGKEECVFDKEQINSIRRIQSTGKGRRRWPIFSIEK